MSDPELEALRQAWQRIEAPEAHRALAEEDADTRRAVAWLQSAFQTLQPAAPARRAMPFRTLGRPRLLRGIRFAAAAALLAALGLGLFRAEPAVSPSSTTVRAPGPELGAPARAPELATEPAPAIQLLASSRERVELRSGAVRLTLLHAPSAAPADPHPSPTQTP